MENVTKNIIHEHWKDIHFKIKTLKINNFNDLCDLFLKDYKSVLSIIVFDKFIFSFFVETFIL